MNQKPAYNQLSAAERQKLADEHNEHYKPPPELCFDVCHLPKYHDQSLIVLQVADPNAGKDEIIVNHGKRYRVRIQLPRPGMSGYMVRVFTVDKNGGEKLFHGSNPSIQMYDKITGDVIQVPMDNGYSAWNGSPNTPYEIIYKKGTPEQWYIGQLGRINEARTTITAEFIHIDLATNPIVD